MVSVLKKILNSSRCRMSVSEARSNYSVVYPGRVTPQLSHNHIPDNVTAPPYYVTGRPQPIYQIDVKSEEQISRLRRTCSLAKSILNQCEKLIKPGITTEEIDKLVTELSFNAAAYPSPLNYRNFPKSVCTSVNNCVCHGIPDDRALEDGDIINVDVTVFREGVHGDCSFTYMVGEVDAEGVELVDVAKQCLQVGLDQCAPGKPIAGIGKAIEKYLRWSRFKVVPAFTGHGIGEYFHGPPDIYPCKNNYPGYLMPGMVFTVEPAISEGSSKVEVLDDGWTAVTKDGSRSAQFEHTVLITESGYEALTS